MRIMDRAREAARLTPADRNRAADFFRIAAIGFVVLGHWILAAPYAPTGQLDMRWIVAERPWTQYLTWIFQVMAVFFFVGGYANAASWTSARLDPEKRRLWAGSRMRRLLLPLVPLVILWALAAVVAHSLGSGEELIRATSRDALVPVWFLAVYIMVTLVAPISYAAWERLGLWSVTLLALLAILVDAIGIGMGQAWLRWANYAPIWLAAHQLGYWWKRGDVSAAKACVLVVLGVVWMAVLVLLAGYPVSMVSVAGEEFSNSLPPTTALSALGAVHVGLLLLVAPLVSKWLRRETPWALVILLGQHIMTIYLWHLTVVSVLIGMSLLLGGFGLQLLPGSAAWWELRPLWLVVSVAVLLLFVAVFGRFESASRIENLRPTGALRTALGTLVSCAGLSSLSLNGVGSEGLLGLNWIAVLLILGGVALAAGMQMTSGRART